MDNVIELFDEGVEIEQKNIILNDGKIEQQSWNLSLPLNEHNKELLHIANDSVDDTGHPTLSYINNTSLKTSVDCLLSLNNQLLFSNLNVDSVDYQTNTIETTLYPNKVINDFMQTEIRKLLYDNAPVAWDAFAYNLINEGIYFWGHVPVNNLLIFYFNGANEHYLKDRTYGIKYGYDEDYLENDPTKPYLYKGLGAFKDFQLHPTFGVRQNIERINQVFRQNQPTFHDDLIDISDVNIDSSFTITSGYEKVAPYWRTQWCCWGLGKYTANGHVYKDGKYSIPIAKLGSHICTEVDNIGNVSEGDGDIIKFNRDCQIQVEKLHFQALYGQTITQAQKTGDIVMSIFRYQQNGEYVEEKLFKFNGSLIYHSASGSSAPSVSHILNNLKSGTDDNVDNLFTNQTFLDTINIHKNDYIRFYIDCSHTNNKLKLSYLNFIVKWKYVENSYEITDDDWDMDMEYYSGLLTQQKDYEDASNYAQGHNLEKMWDIPYFDCIAAMFWQDRYTSQIERWDEMPCYNYYSYWMNFGEYTPLKLISDICVKKGWSLIQKPNGCFKILPYKSPQTLNNCQLQSVDYLNETFGKLNYITYEGDGKKYVGADKSNTNLESTKTLYSLYCVEPNIRGNYHVNAEYEQEGEITDDDKGCKFKEQGNYISEGQILDTLNNTLWFDGVIGLSKSYVYTYKVPTTNVTSDVIVINGLLYMVISSKIDIANNTTEIKCFRL